MKNIYKNTAIITAIMITLGNVSCKNDFLEVTPKGKLIAQKVDDYNLLLNNLELLNVNSLSQVPMGDEVDAIQEYFVSASLKSQRLFRWDPVIYESDQDADEMKVYMKNIYTYNKIINEIDAATEGSDAEKNSIKAEAMAGRAWTYFQLINYYGKPYQESTSSTDPGFPIVTKADVTETTFERTNVKAVYEFIVDGLKEAIPNLPNRTINRLRMSRSAAEAILGKVYLFMGQPYKAVEQLNNAVNNTAHTDISLSFYDYNTTALPTSITVAMNTEVIYGKQSSNYWTINNLFATGELVIKPATVALFEATDKRLGWYAASPRGASAIYPQGMKRRIAPSITQIGMTLPDLYLLRAEANARIGDLDGAVQDLLTLRNKRMPTNASSIPQNIASDQKSLLNFVIEERIREFAVQGYRWFDMRRLSVDPLFADIPTPTHTIYTMAGDAVDTYTLSTNRYVLRFPDKVMNENPNMQNND